MSGSSIPLITMSVFMLILCGFSYYKPVGELEIRDSDTSGSSFMYRIFFLLTWDYLLLCFCGYNQLSWVGVFLLLPFVELDFQIAID